MESVRTLSDALLGFSATKADELSMLQVCLRAVVVYLVLIGYVRFAKKRFLSEATGFDAILVIVIGSIASRAISGTAPFFSSLAGTFVLILRPLGHFVHHPELSLSQLRHQRHRHGLGPRGHDRPQGFGSITHVR